MSKSEVKPKAESAKPKAPAGTDYSAIDIPPSELIELPLKTQNCKLTKWKYTTTLN